MALVCSHAAKCYDALNVVVQGTPIVNYGVLIAALHGILERAISPFIDELEG